MLFDNVEDRLLKEVRWIRKVLESATYAVNRYGDFDGLSLDSAVDALGCQWVKAIKDVERMRNELKEIKLLIARGESDKAYWKIEKILSQKG